MIRNLYIGVGMLLTFLACSKDSIEKPEMYKALAYFPMEENTYWIYSQTLITIDAAVDVFDTTTSELKMKFIAYDEELDQFRLDRFSRPDSLSLWEELDVILLKWDKISMHWVEDNYRYVKLTDPVYANKSWDGNIYNILDEWDYYYSDLNTTFEIDDLIFPNTIRVEKKKDENAIQYTRAFEVFQKSIGPVYEYNADFSLQSGEINKGNSLELVLLKYGIE